MATQVQQMPFALLGGAEPVREIVDRFYDLMEQDPRYAALRAIHQDDLSPMRDSLAGFLNAWLGGPRDWFVTRPGMCIMSLHRRIGVTEQTAEQWADAMARAIAGQPGLDPKLGVEFAEALARMCQGMARQSALARESVSD